MALSLNLLLIDDNAVDADLLRANLESIPGMECRFEWVPEFEDGIQAVCRNDFDVCFIDQNLGGKSGMELISEAAKRGCRRPMILYSGREDVRLGVEAISLGAVDYLVKDHIDPFLLEKTLRSILERDRILQDNARMQAKLYETQRLESLGLMASGIAHDFNNILGIILANAELAIQANTEAEDNPTSRYLASIRLATERAAELTSQMLAYSGRGRFRSQTLDIKSMAQEILEFCRVSIPRRVHLEMKASQAVGSIYGDPTQIRQVIMNLVHNAADSIEEEGRVLVDTLELDYRENGKEGNGFVSPLPSGKYVVFRVSDNGCGIPKDQITRIFDPFFTTKTKGRGLGLAAVLGIVKAHKGSVRITGEVGKGTTMEVWLPQSGETAAGEEMGTKRVREEKVSAAPSEPHGEARVFGKHNPPQVLVVDDETGILQALEIMLQGRGYQPLLALDAQEAMGVLEANTIDAAIIDIMLAGRSGIDLFHDIRGKIADLPVVFISGYNESEALLPLVRRGEVQYLRKPFSSSQLTEALEKACQYRLRSNAAAAH